MRRKIKPLSDNSFSSIWFDDQEYGKILDELVIVCVDTLVYHTDKGVLLGLRNRLPLLDWWIFGGRMRAKENYVQSAKRGLLRELGINPTNTPQLIGYFDLVWEQREEIPQENGCHLLLVAMKYQLSDREVERLTKKGRDDHSNLKWFTEKDIRSTNFHPTLSKIINDSGVLNTSE